MSTTGKTLVEVRDLEMHFPIKQGIIFQKQVGAVRAVDGVTFDVHDGETLGIVGESGCGKSTTARAIMRLLDPTGGSVTYDGQDITHLSPRELLPVRREMQMIFQDPYSSLDPRQTVGSVIAEPFVIHGIEKDERRRKAMVQELMEQVGLNPEHYNRLPHQFSGGQRQRIGVARAIALKPKLIVADEPVSALDVSIQAQIINLLRDLQRDLGLTIIFIAHDLSVVRHMCDRIAVMYLGKVVELASADELFSAPRHPYTGALLSAVPVADPALAKAQDPPGARRRRAVADGAAAGLPLPHALPARAGDLRPRRAAAGVQGRRLAGGVPLPAERGGRGEDGPHRHGMSAPAGATDRVVAALRAAGVEPDIHEFPQGTRTSQDAADAVGCDVAQIAKSIVFRLDRDGEEPEALLVITSGPNRVDVAKAGALAGGLAVEGRRGVRARAHGLCDRRGAGGRARPADPGADRRGPDGVRGRLVGGWHAERGLPDRLRRCS